MQIIEYFDWRQIASADLLQVYDILQQGLAVEAIPPRMWPYETIVKYIEQQEDIYYENGKDKHDNRVYLAKNGQDIAGILIGKQMDDVFPKIHHDKLNEENKTLLNTCCEIDALVTNKAYRGKGVATALIHRFCERYSRDNVAVETDHINNDQAINFYQNLGFRMLSEGYPYNSSGIRGETNRKVLCFMVVDRHELLEKTASKLEALKLKETPRQTTR